MSTNSQRLGNEAQALRWPDESLQVYRRSDPKNPSCSRGEPVPGKQRMVQTTRWMNFAAICVLMRASSYAESESALKGYVARYRASSLEDRVEVRKWPSHGGTNPVPLLQVEKPLNGDVSAPSTRTVRIHGFNHRAVRFLKGKRGEGELLEAKGLLPNGHPTRTIFAVYRVHTHSSSWAARLGGFGASRVEEGLEKAVWNFGVDVHGEAKQGSLKFDGERIGPHLSTRFIPGQVILRALVMHDSQTFSEYLQPAHDFIQIKKVLNQAKPSSLLHPIRGHFYLGDLHAESLGGGHGEVILDVFDVTVFDRALGDKQIRSILKELNWQYTNPVQPAADGSG